jgi:molybdopterin-guanine dinucleotide biosynthesis protein MobB
MLQIVGRKKSGKTSLIVDLLPLLRANGLRVGTVKHTTQIHPLDASGTDSHKHREAGAETTLVITREAGALHFALPGERTQIEALPDRYLGHLDLVLIEGWKQRRGPKIEILSANDEGTAEEPLFAGDPDLLGMVLPPGATSLPKRIDAGRILRWEDVKQIAAFVIDWVRSG